jgi:hypothetical protein
MEGKGSNSEGKQNPNTKLDAFFDIALECFDSLDIDIAIQQINTTENNENRVAKNLNPTSAENPLVTTTTSTTTTIGTTHEASSDENVPQGSQSRQILLGSENNVGVNIFLEKRLLNYFIQFNCFICMSFIYLFIYLFIC